MINTDLDHQNDCFDQRIFDWNLVVSVLGLGVSVSETVTLVCYRSHIGNLIKRHKPPNHGNDYFYLRPSNQGAALENIWEILVHVASRDARNVYSQLNYWLIKMKME